MQKHLEEINRSIATKAHGVIIMDGAGWHKSGALKVPKNLSILFLPPYSPELNPDEYLNCDLKAGVHSGPPARTRKQLKQKALSHLRKLQKMPKRIMKYFRHPKIAYAS